MAAITASHSFKQTNSLNNIMENSFNIPGTKQYTINHALQVADIEMRISMILTLEEDGHLEINIENEVTGSESNFSLSKEELEGILAWVNE